MIDAATLAKLGTEIKNRIDLAWEKEPDPRWHLGASVVGDECMRKVWLDYRWVRPERFSGRMQRLFQRGHDEEAKLTAHLSLIGINIETIDPTTNKQFRGTAFFGHFGGSGDGLGCLPADLCGLKCIFEFKTHKHSSFLQLVKHGVKASKPKHHMQMCIYGSFFDCEYAVYVAVDKDTDELHVEVITLDKDKADEGRRKAELLISAQTPPPRISPKASFYICKQCHFSPICHNGEDAIANCRSCRFARPLKDGEWGCERFEFVIPRDKAKLGCGAWESVLNNANP